jgi:hypothetical protein
MVEVALKKALERNGRQSGTSRFVYADNKEASVDRKRRQISGEFLIRAVA